MVGTGTGKSGVVCRFGGVHMSFFSPPPPIALASSRCDSAVSRPARSRTFTYGSAKRRTGQKRWCVCFRQCGACEKCVHMCLVLT